MKYSQANKNLLDSTRHGTSLEKGVQGQNGLKDGLKTKHGRGSWYVMQHTLRAPPKRRQATAFLISSCPKMLGAMRWKISSVTLGWAAKSRNSASSSILAHTFPHCFSRTHLFCYIGLSYKVPKLCPLLHSPSHIPT
jgi:hypothetical protein